MGKASGVSRRRKKVKSHRYNSSKKLKRVRKRELKKNNSISCELVREAWNVKRTLKDNMKSMGLAHDPNKLLSGPNFLEKFAKQSSIDDGDIVSNLHRQLQKKKQRYELKKSNNNSNFTVSDIEQQSDNNDNLEKKSVADRLAEVASKPKVGNFRFGPDNVKFCAYLIEKYGTDYEAMVRDQKNYYQESAGQIRSKIRRFLANSSHQKVYESAKKMVEADLANDDDNQMED